MTRNSDSAIGRLLLAIVNQMNTRDVSLLSYIPLPGLGRLSYQYKIDWDEVRSSPILIGPPPPSSHAANMRFVRFRDSVMKPKPMIREKPTRRTRLLKGMKRVKPDNLVQSELKKKLLPCCLGTRISKELDPEEFTPGNAAQGRLTYLFHEIHSLVTTEAKSWPLPERHSCIHNDQGSGCCVPGIGMLSSCIKREEVRSSSQNVSDSEPKATSNASPCKVTSKTALLKEVTTTGAQLRPIPMIDLAQESSTKTNTAGSREQAAGMKGNASEHVEDRLSIKSLIN